MGVRLVGVRLVGICLLGLGLVGERGDAAVGSALALEPPRRRLPLAAGAASLWVAVLAATLATAIVAALRADPDSANWEAFAVLAGAAAVAQVFVVRTGLNQAFHTALVFVTAGALLLPPELIVLMAVVQHIPEWIKERYPAYIQIFNIGNFALDGLAGWAVENAIRSIAGEGALGWALSGIAAAAAIVVLNHLVLAAMLRLARGHSLRESELFTGRALGLDLALGLLGITAALCWRSDAWVIVTLVAPLVAAQWGFAMVGRLREGEQRFRAMFDAAPFGVKLTDLDGNVIEANPALERMLGYSTGELNSLPIAPTDDGSEQRLTAADGRDVLARVAVAPVPDADGRPKYELAVVEDVTRRADLEEQLRQAQRLEGLGRLAGGVAHDFNNLLTAINGYAEIALERLETDDATHDDLSEILRAGKRAAELTAQLLAFGRRQMLQPKDVNLNELVTESHNMLRRVIGEHVELGTIFYGPDVPRVHADPGQLEQVIMNLVVNARDAMPDGGSITIETSSVVIDEDCPLWVEADAGPGPHALLAVRDTGEGVPAEHLARIFDPFFTTKEVGKGTGLGLATVYGIVRQSGGFVTVSTMPGLGSTFSVYLPRVPDAVEAAAEKAALPPRSGSERVLLVEDEPVVRELVGRMLRVHGYDVLIAEDGPTALELVRSEAGRIDVLVTDVVMPQMSGPELGGLVRAEHPETRILYTSGYADTALTGGDLHADGSAFLQKPFGVAELTQKLRALIEP